MPLDFLPTPHRPCAIACIFTAVNMHDAAVRQELDICCIGICRDTMLTMHWHNCWTIFQLSHAHLVCVWWCLNQSMIWSMGTRYTDDDACPTYHFAALLDLFLIRACPDYNEFGHAYKI